MNSVFPSLPQEWDALLSHEHAAIEHFVRHAFAAYEQTPQPVNFDRLMGAGIRFARTGISALDCAAIAWLMEQPGPRRLDIVSSFLNGYWHSTVFPSPASEQAILDFASLRPQLPTDDQANSTAVMALCRATALPLSPAVQERLSIALRNALDEQYQRPTIKESIDSQIRKALAGQYR